VFSGIVKGVGRIAEQIDLGGDRRLVVATGDAALGSLEIGASIAVNGVCLTATAATAERFTADVSGETLAVTTFARLGPGARVNLEPPLKAGQPLDGHLVTGHIDGVGEVIELAPVGRSLRLGSEVPAPLSRYIAAKGSVAVDGVSLTVNAVHGRRFEVNIIPHTQAVTVIGEYRLGSAVNIEVDMIARYLERLVHPDVESGIDMQLLKDHGYARND
jgi:riboflavin synthase